MTQLYTWYLFSLDWIIILHNEYEKLLFLQCWISSSNKPHQFRAAAQCFGDLHHYRIMMETGKFPKFSTSAPSWHNFSPKNNFRYIQLTWKPQFLYDVYTTAQHASYLLFSTYCASSHMWDNTEYYFNTTHLSLLIKELEQINYIFTFGITFAFASYKL